MIISYAPLWKTLIDKGINKTDLCQSIGISTATIAKMSKNKIVSLGVIVRICESLNCRIEDICEVI